MTTLYLAGAMFTAAEQDWQCRMAACFREQGFHVFLPQEFSFPWLEIKRGDRQALLISDAVIGWLEGPDPDSGTAWELGFAEGIGKPIVTYTTDFRFTGEGMCDLNPMVTEGILRFPADASPTGITVCLVERLRQHIEIPNWYPKPA